MNTDHLLGAGSRHQEHAQAISWLISQKANKPCSVCPLSYLSFLLRILHFARDTLILYGYFVFVVWLFYFFSVSLGCFLFVSTSASD